MEVYNQVYKYLLTIDKLSKEDYDFLVSNYDVNIVNSVIENMISEDSQNVFKFDYYVSVILLENDFTSLSSADLYLHEMRSIPRLSSESNKKYIADVYQIVMEIKSLFLIIANKYGIKKNNKKKNDDEEEKNTVLLVDEIDFYLKNCKEKEILNRLRELYSKFIEIRNILVEGNLRLVVTFAKQYYVDKESFLEVIQNGNMGLMRAIENFDPNYGVSFSTYAYFWIKQSINNSLIVGASGQYVTSKMHSLNTSRIKAIEKLTFDLGRFPTQNEIASYMKISVEKLNLLENTFTNPMSLDVPVVDCHGREYGIDLVETMSDYTADVFDIVCKNDLIRKLKLLMKENLTDKEIYILMRRCCIFGKKVPLRQIGEELGCTKQNVSLYEIKALKTLRRVASKELREFLG